MQTSTTTTPFLNTNSLLRTLGIRPQVINVPQENTVVDGYNKKQIAAKEKQDKERKQQQQHQKYLPLSEENVLHLSHEYID